MIGMKVDVLIDERRAHDTQCDRPDHDNMSHQVRTQWTTERIITDCQVPAERRSKALNERDSRELRTNVVLPPSTETSWCLLCCKR